jgi:PDZ domain-containing secreted protein
MTLTDDQLNILNHVVEDGQAWANHAGKKNMLAKVEKYKQSYLDAQGDGYQTRKQREDASVIAEQERYDNVTYDVKRRREYPTIAELVVALYDTDDKADIDKRRAEVKAKYPKP